MSWRFADGGKPLAIDETNQFTTWMVLKVCGLMKDVLLNLINLKKEESLVLVTTLVTLLCEWYV